MDIDTISELAGGVAEIFAEWNPLLLQQLLLRMSELASLSSEAGSLVIISAHFIIICPLPLSVSHTYYANLLIYNYNNLINLYTISIQSLYN